MKILLILTKLILSISYNLRLMEVAKQNVRKEKLNNWETLEFLSKSAQNITRGWQTISPLQIRKLSLIDNGTTYYQLQNSTMNLIYEFAEPITVKKLYLNLTVFGETGENITSDEPFEIKNDDTKKVNFTFNENSLKEGLYNVSFYDEEKNEYKKNNRSLLIFKNQLSIGERKISYQLIDEENDDDFNLTINLKAPIFKEQIFKITYLFCFPKCENDSIENENKISNYRLNEEKNILILTLDKNMKKEFRNITFSIYDNKDQYTDDSTLSFTLIVTNFIILNPIIFINSSSKNESKDVTFKVKFSNKVTSIDQNEIKILINGNQTLKGTDNFKEDTREVDLTFTKNPNEVKEYFIEYKSKNSKNYSEYRNIYLATYDIFDDCQEISNITDIFIDINFTINLQGIVDVFMINLDNENENENPIFNRYTNSTIYGNLIKYTYYLKKAYINKGEYILKADSKVLDLVDNYIDKDNLNLKFFQKYSLDNSQKNINKIYTDLDKLQNISLFFNENINIKKIQLTNKNNVIINSDSDCSVNENKQLFCYFSKIPNEKDGIYNINYEGDCGKSIQIDESEVYVIYTNNLISINPPIVEELSNTTVTLEYKEKLESDFSIKLININDSSTINIKNDDVSINNNKYTFNPNKNEVKEGIYYVYNIFQNETKSYKSDLKFKVTKNILSFTFNRYLFVLNNTNNEYPFNHDLTITPSNPSLVSSIYYQNINKNLSYDINNNYYYDTMKSNGIYTFYYIDKDINESIPIENATVYVVLNYSILFDITPIISNCNFFYLKVAITSNPNVLKINLSESVLQIEHNNSIVKTIIFEEQKYIINFTDFSPGTNYTIKIFEKKDDKSQWIYFKNNVYFTNLAPPDYHDKQNTTITFFNVTCNFTKSSSTIQFKYESLNNSKQVSCNGTYYPDSKELNCIIIYNNNYGYHDIYVNEDYNLSKRTFLSNSICNAYFEIEHSNSSISDKNNTINITNSYRDFYMPRLESIEYIVNENEEVPITIKINENDYIKIDNEYKINLIVNYGANYKILIKNLKRKKEKWENNSYSSCLEKEFNSYENNLYSHYLYQSEIPIIYINQNNTSTYPITIKFVNQTFAENYQDSFYNLNCIRKDEDDTLNCKFSSPEQNLGIQSFNINGLNNSDKSKYVSYYSYYGKKCQLLSSSMSEIYISVSSPVALGNISLYYLNNTLDQTQNNLSNNSNYNVYNFTFRPNVNIERKPVIYAKAEKNYTSQIPLSDLGIFFYTSYQIESVKGNLLSYSDKQQEILIKFTSSINTDSFESLNFKLKNEKYEYEATIQYFSEDSIILIFNSSEEREVGEYELNLIICGDLEPLNFKVSIIKFTTNRKYYVKNNNYNKENIFGLIEGGKNDLYIEQYFDNGTYISQLIDNKNGSYSYPINTPGQYNFTFRNYESATDTHDINIYIKVVEEVNDYYEIIDNNISHNQDNCYYDDFSFQINWKNTFIEHQVLLLGPNVTCDDGICEIEGINENYTVSKNSFGLQDGYSYYILVTENGDTSIPLDSFQFTFFMISLSEFNKRFIYLNAPYIQLISNCNFTIKEKELVFSNDDEEFKIKCNIQNDDNICYYSDDISNQTPGYFKITYDKYILSNRTFLSQAIELASFEILNDIDDLKIGNNTIFIKSKDFFLENVEKYYISKEDDYLNYEKPNEFNLSRIDSMNNSNSIISFIVNLTKNEPKYFWGIQRKKIEYDDEQFGIKDFKNIPNLKFEVFINSFRFSFDKVYIIEKAKSLCINNDNYNKVTITITSDDINEFDKINNITYRYIKEDSNETGNEILTADDYKNLPKLSNESSNVYYFFIIEYGIYKFYYGSNNKEYSIDTIVIAVEEKEKIFKFTLEHSCILKDYFPNITISEEIPLYKNYIDLSKIGFLLYDINDNIYISYNFIGDSYILNEPFEKLNKYHDYELKITEKDNRNCFIWSEPIILYDKLTPLSNKLYEDYILFQNISCYFGNIFIKKDDDENKIQLLCGEINKNSHTLQCAYNINFTNKYYDTYQLYINDISMNNSISIYNSILNATFSFFVLDLISYDDKPIKISISSNNEFDMNDISEVNITNNVDEEIIQCTKNSEHNCVIEVESSNSIVINPTLNNNQKIYYIYKISRPLQINETGNNTKLLNIPIENTFYFTVDKNIVVLENSDNTGIVILQVSGIQNDSINTIFAKKDNQDIPLTRINSTYYIFNYTEEGKYIFYYKLFTGNHKTNKEVEFIKKGTDIFSIQKNTKCFFAKYFNININYQRDDLDFVAFLNDTKLDNSENNYYFNNNLLLYGEYELLIKDKNNINNIFFKGSINDEIFNLSDLFIEEYYYFDHIYFTKVSCKFDILTLQSNKEDQDPLKLSCGDVKNETIICQIENIDGNYGYNSILFENNNLKKTFISNTIDKTIFKVTPIDDLNETITLFTIKANNGDFYLKSIKNITLYNKVMMEDKITFSKYDDSLKYNSDSDNLTFSFLGKEGGIYQLTLYREEIDNYEGKESIDYENDLEFKSLFSLTSIYYFLEEENKTFNIILETNEDLEDSLMKIDPEECNFENDIINCNFNDNNLKQIIRINYNDSYIRSFYILVAKNANGKKCDKIGSLKIELHKPNEFNKDITTTFDGGKIKYQTKNTSNDNFINYTYIVEIDDINNLNMKVKVDSDEQNITLPTNNFPTFKQLNIINITHSLEEGNDFQNLTLEFKESVFYNELKKCTIFNHKSIDGECENNDVSTKINCKFNLTGLNAGDYKIKCTNLCDEDSNDFHITIKEKNCSLVGMYKIKHINNSGIFCDDCYSINNTYYFNGTCRENCSIEIGYAINNPLVLAEDFRCIKCIDEGKFYQKEEEQCQIKCSSGTISNKNKSECYLPDDEENYEYIKGLPGEEYCIELCATNFDKCDRVWNNCTCNNNYQGIYCEYKENDIQVNPIFKNVVEYFKINPKITRLRASIVANVKSLLDILGKNNDLINDLEDMNYFIDRTIELENITDYNVYYFIELSLFLLKHQDSSSRRLDDENFKKTDNILSFIHKINKNSFLESYPKLTNDFSVKILTNNLIQTSWIWCKKKQLNEVINSNLANYNGSSLVLFDLDECNELDKDIIIVLTIKSINLIKKENTGIDVEFELYYGNNPISPSICTKINNKIYISQSTLAFEIVIHKFYKEKGIDIYNKNDKAFKDPCFQSEKLSWDLTQKYRKNNLYQNLTYKTNNYNCIYFDTNYSKNVDNYLMIYQCTDFDISIKHFNFINTNDIIENNEQIYNLPFKCHNKVKKIHKNIGFWLYLIITILYISSFIVNSFLDSSLNAIQKGAKYDKFILSNPPNKNSAENNSIDLEDNGNNNSNENKTSQNITDNNDPQIKNDEEEKKDTNEINLNNWPIQFFNFQSCLQDNLFSLHPLLRIIRCSIISPLMINQFIVLFNISTLFAFNAILLPEKRIERKIWDKGRDKFVYPMKHEFGRILLSILISMLFTFIIRAVSLVSFKSQNDLKETIILEYNEKGFINNNRNSNVKRFTRNHQVFKTICSIIIFLINIFYWYYTIVWCYVYYNAQFGWFYAGIWSLFWIWIVFAPIYIVIISILQYKMTHNEIWIYYIQNLFCF